MAVFTQVQQRTYSVASRNKTNNVGTVNQPFVIATDGVMDAPPKAIPIDLLLTVGPHPLEEIMSFLDPCDLARVDQVCKKITKSECTARQWQSWQDKLLLGTNKRSNTNNNTDEADVISSNNNNNINTNLRCLSFMSPAKHRVARYYQACTYARKMEFIASCVFDYSVNTSREISLSSRYRLPDLDARPWTTESTDLWKQCGSLWKGSFSIFVRLSKPHHYGYEQNESSLTSLEDFSESGEDSEDDFVVWQGYVPYKLCCVPPSASLILHLQHLRLKNLRTSFPLSATVVLQPHDNYNSVHPSGAYNNSSLVLPPCSLLCATAGLGFAVVEANNNNGAGQQQQQQVRPTSTLVLPMRSPPAGTRRSRRQPYEWNDYESVVVAHWRYTDSQLQGISLSCPKV